MHRFRKHLGTMEKIMGLLLVLTGLLFMGSFLADVKNMLIEMVPAIGPIARTLGMVFLVAGIVGVFMPSRAIMILGFLFLIIGMTLIGGSINAFGQWLIETFPGLGMIESYVTPEGLQNDIMRKGAQ